MVVAQFVVVMVVAVVVVEVTVVVVVVVVMDAVVGQGDGGRCCWVVGSGSGRGRADGSRSHQRPKCKDYGCRYEIVIMLRAWNKLYNILW